MASYKRALVILNPSSGRHNTDDTRRLIETKLSVAGLACEVRLTGGTGDALAWAERACSDGFDLVIAAGGDGTVMEAMSGLLRAKAEIPLAQIPLGTANLLARALTIPSSPGDAMNVIFSGRVEQLDVGYLPDHDRYFALMAGCGYDARRSSSR